MKKLKPWTEVYPQGTAEGNEEQRFFIALARNKKYDWRSLAAVAKEANLTKKRAEEIMKKYHGHPTCPVFNNPKNEEQWAYWGRVPEMCPKDTPSLSATDQKKRVDKILPSAIVDLSDPDGGLYELGKPLKFSGKFQEAQKTTSHNYRLGMHEDITKWNNIPLSELIKVGKSLGSNIIVNDKVMTVEEAEALIKS